MEEYTDFSSDELVPPNINGHPYIAFIDANAKVAKKQRLNPPGDDVYMRQDGTLYYEIDAIRQLQRAFLHRYYKPEGKGGLEAVSRLKSVQKIGKGDETRPSNHPNERVGCGDTTTCLSVHH